MGRDRGASAILRPKARMKRTETLMGKVVALDYPYMTV